MLPKNYLEVKIFFFGADHFQSLPDPVNNIKFFASFSSKIHEEKKCESYNIELLLLAQVAPCFKQNRIELEKIKTEKNFERGRDGGGGR